MRPVTENMSDKEHRAATRELQTAVDAIPATPTGTGFPHVTAGVMDGASKLIDTADVNADQITYAKIQNVSANKLIGSVAGGDPEEIDCTAAGRALLDDANAAAQLVTLGAAATASPAFTGTVTLPVGLTGVLRADAGVVSTDSDVTNLVTEVTSGLHGLAPASGGGTANFLRADATWAAPPTTSNPRVFISEQTGTGPWTWSSLNGDASGLRGYEIVGRCTKVAAALHRIAVQFNGDTGANYTDTVGTAATFAIVASGTGSNETMAGRVTIDVAKSGFGRCLTGQFMVLDDGPTTYVMTPDTAWLGTAAITSISLINSTGSVDDGVWALYALMDAT